jgi:hypothetical protein
LTIGASPLFPNDVNDIPNPDHDNAAGTNLLERFFMNMGTANNSSGNTSKFSPANAIAD